MDLVIQYITYPLYSIVKEHALSNPFGLVGDWKLESSASPPYFPVSSLTFSIWSRPGSNRQPLACKASALPIELRPRFAAPGNRRSRPAPKDSSAESRSAAAFRSSPSALYSEDDQEQGGDSKQRPLAPVHDSTFRPGQPFVTGPDKIRTCDLVLIRDAL